MNNYVSADVIRNKFSTAMSMMYQSEVPQYGTLLDIVRKVNAQTLIEYPELLGDTDREQEISRVNVERHGAIRLGTAEELSMMKDVFAVMGMFPVGYYDLSAAGVPVHSTAFRPLSERSLQINPFRIFTSLLRLELIENVCLRECAKEILAKRDIFTYRAKEMVVLHDEQGGLTGSQADIFVTEILETFRWHHDASVDLQTYEALLQQHRLIADVVCFRGPHINHLTPRTLDIDKVQQMMPEWGITPKEIIEGPPQRKCPILLRQTSFKALNEVITFINGAKGTHTARFGEIEQRGIALTPKGRALYDRLLKSAFASGKHSDNTEHQAHITTVFSEFPDDFNVLRMQRLAYFRYKLVETTTTRCGSDDFEECLEHLIDKGTITFSPITYEDFLPVSAAGIFQSNLGADIGRTGEGKPNQAVFERALGCPVINEFSLYQQIEQDSLVKIRHELTDK